MTRRLTLVVIMTTVLSVAPALADSTSVEPPIAFSYGYRHGPNLRFSVTLMNDSATTFNFSREPWGQAELIRRDSLRLVLDDKVMLMTVMVVNFSSSADTLVFPGDAEVVIIHDGQYISAVRSPPDTEIAPGRRVVFFLEFRRFRYREGDTFGIRPKD